MNILYAEVDEVAKECFIVYVALGDGKFLYHNGPADFAYFCEEEARELAKRLNAARQIDPNAFNDGTFCDMTIRDMEDEYYNRGA